LSRDKLILILFVFIWIGIIAYNSGFFETARVVPVGKIPVRPTAALPSALEDLPELRLDLLDSPRPPYKGIKKNIFSPLKFPVPIEGRFRVAEITDTVLRFSDELSGEAASIGLESE
jgi:hypothetical protein